MPLSLPWTRATLVILPLMATKRETRSAKKRGAEMALTPAAPAAPPRPVKRQRVDSPAEQWKAELQDGTRFEINVEIFNFVVKELDQWLYTKRLYLDRPVPLDFDDWATGLFEPKLVPPVGWRAQVLHPDFKHEVALVLQRSGYDAFFFKQEDKNKGNSDWLSVCASR